MTIRSILLAAITALALSSPVSVLAADPAPGSQVAPAAPAGGSAVNRFNRLMKTSGPELNAPPTTDGIHDATNPGTEALQPPREAFTDLPRSNAGNRIDWVKALQSGAIQPRSDVSDPNKQKQLMDLDIIRVVKGSMPDVVYPHKQHTEWLDCAQCHPKIFVPKKGANAISMAAILMGQYCGACHGKVAFPVSECTKCHSKAKDGSQIQRSENAPAPAPAPVAEPVAVAAAAPAPAAAAPAAPAANLTKDGLMKKGATVYAENCSGCHGEKGEGVPDTFPALKGSKIAKGPAADHIKIVVHGKADTAMQAWGESMSDEDIASVITFERNSWGNKMGDLVQPAAVRAAR